MTDGLDVEPVPRAVTVDPQRTQTAAVTTGVQTAEVERVQRPSDESQTTTFPIVFDSTFA